MTILLEKLKEVLFSVVPMAVLILILSFTIAPMPGVLLVRFVLGAVLIVIGMSGFLLGVDLSVTPLGNDIGVTLSKSNKLWIVASVSIVVGFFMSVAEPDLQILAGQVDSVTLGVLGKVSMLVVVSIGVAVLLALGLVRIVYSFPLYKTLFVLYGIILLLACFVPPEFLAISFDSSGATTGSLTVPFILALAVGVSGMKRNGKASEKDSFGLAAIASTGAIIGVLFMSILSGSPHLTGTLERTGLNATGVLQPFAKYAPSVALESVITVLPLMVIFLVFQIRVFHLKKKPLRRIWKGFLYTLIGLILFMTGVNAGFMDVGTAIGMKLAEKGNLTALLAVGFALGFVAILAEPAVHILTQQIETVTAGSIKRITILIALAVGVGAAVALSVLRVAVPEIQLWHYLLPGYIISIGLSFFTPKLFVGIAFDSGGVASGTMTATFILAFTKGIAEAVAGADVLRDAFGMIALVAMTPIITLQILGLLFKIKSHKRGVTTNV